MKYLFLSVLMIGVSIGLVGCEDDDKDQPPEEVVEEETVNDDNGDTVVEGDSNNRTIYHNNFENSVQSVLENADDIWAGFAVVYDYINSIMSVGDTYVMGETSFVISDIDVYEMSTYSDGFMIGDGVYLSNHTRVNIYARGDVRLFIYLSH